MPRLVTHDEVTVVGISVRTSNTAETDPATAKIAGLWARFYQDDVRGKTPAKSVPAIPLAVYTDYERDHEGQYQVIVGAAVDPKIPTPEGMARATIPAGTYLLFEAEGDMPDVVIDTWKAIWSYFSNSSNHVRAYVTDVEAYPGERAVRIYISIRTPAAQS